MRIIRLTIERDGRTAVSTTVREHAVAVAKARAANTGKPVSVIAHLDNDGTREVAFRPDGTSERIWSADKGRPLTPAVGRTYANRDGGEYLCTGTADGSGNTAGTFLNVKNGWTFAVGDPVRYADGTIAWEHIVDGHSGLRQGGNPQ